MKWLHIQFDKNTKCVNQNVHNQLSHFGLIEDLSSDSISLKLTCSTNAKRRSYFLRKVWKYSHTCPLFIYDFFFMFHHVHFLIFLIFLFLIFFIFSFFSGAIRRSHKPSLWPLSDLKNLHSKVPTQKIFGIWSSTF